MRFLVLGKTGQLGAELQRALAPLGPVVALDRSQCDLAVPDSLPQVLRQYPSDVVLNAAAYTAVDRAEAEQDLAQTVNAWAPGVLAAQAQAAGQLLIHYSTDYVFDGSTSRPYTEDDVPRPLSVYGQTKLEGERAVQRACKNYLILRTSWLYSMRRANFVTQVLEWSRKQPALHVVTDQVGSPTWARVIAEATAGILSATAGDLPVLSLPSGVYHVACAGAVSRWELAREVLRLDPRPAEQLVSAEAILPARSREFPTPAARPAYSALDSTLVQRRFGLILPAWSDSLRSAMQAG
ncbi:MAG: dTDP-4-dehydrorhamnose reductase [Anaerolineales bacterium]